MFTFEVKKTLHSARLTRLTTPHGEVEGPFFQFVATQAAIRGGVYPEDLRRLGVQIVLANTYHLHLRPGEDIVDEAGGLHGFMQWDGPITTDSGGYQVFSLAKNVRIDSDGVTFRSLLDGGQHRITPKLAIEIQQKLGADIIMPLDVCTAFGATKEYIAAAVNQTTEWATICKEALHNDRQALYGIVQGGVYRDLRERSAEQLRELDFFGYSIGGELQEKGEKRIAEMSAFTASLLPKDKPRYLMGYGTPEDILAAVRGGVDQFDCVLPIRNARHGNIFYDLNREELKLCLTNPEREIVRENLYRVKNIRNAKFTRDHLLFSHNPVFDGEYSNAYVHHLLKAEPPSAFRLLVLQNIWFYAEFMREIRAILTEC